MINISISLTLLSIGTIFGIALAASIVVHPLLLKVKRETALETFKPFFFNTHRTQISLSVIVTVFAIISTFLSGNWWWIVGVVIMHLNGPFTKIKLMPVNHRLLAEDIDPHAEQTGEDLIMWGKLHAVRTVVNGVVFVLFIILAVYK